ncbi:heat shock 70 kDa protein 1A-like [Haemaphysalis longicornis]
MEKNPNALAIGIDLGTTYSCVAIYHFGKVEIIANDQGNRTTPSCVAFTETERLIGDAAKLQVALNPENTVFGAKRLIGRKYNDPKLQDDLRHLPFKIIDDNNTPKIKVMFKGEEKIFSPEEISAMILSHMREVAEAYLGDPVTLACVTVPAYFNDSQRQATKDAGTIAGLSVPKIINEPTAAALAYGLDKITAGEKKVLIVDLGGGTFDVSLLSIKDSQTFDVLATAGDTHLGGEDFDSRMVDFFLEEIKRKFKVDISDNARAVRRLRIAAERAKRILSSTVETSIEVDALFEGNDFRMKITRARFEELCLDLFKSILGPIERALTDSGVGKEMVDDIVMVGGSTRIPRIQRLVKEFFDKKPCLKINPDEAIAYGAAVCAAMTAGVKDDHLREVKLLDVAPLSLGIETFGGMMSKIISRNTKVPCKISKSFTTYADNQTGVTIQVYEGERTMTQHNRHLGRFELTGIPPAPRGIPKIRVTFDIDENGILSVSARDESTGKAQTIVITHEKGRLSKKEMDRMLKEAETHRLDDIAQRERAAARNSLQSYIFSVQQALSEVACEKFKPEEKEPVVAKCKDVHTWLDQNPNASAGDIQAKLKEVQDVSLPLMVKLHRH